MAALTFGDLVPCRRCNATGEVRHAKPDKATVAQREKMRRQGIDLDPVPSMDPCPACGGKGFVPPQIADRPVA